VVLCAFEVLCENKMRIAVRFSGDLADRLFLC